MPLNVDAVGFTTPPVIVTWDSKDCLLYALGVGAGATDPTGAELEFTTENSDGVDQRVLPTFPLVVQSGPGVLEALGSFDRAKMVHAAQTIELYAPLSANGTVTVEATITGIYDKGSAAVVMFRTDARNVDDGKPRWGLISSLFIRGEGGWGGERGPSVKAEFPERPADFTISCPTRTDQALIYRLSGDHNPLHSDPVFAARAGFPRPILHGLCSFGFTGRALLHSLCASDPDRFVSMSARFSKPVMPGDELTVSAWKVEDGKAVFRTTTADGVVLDAGQLTYQN
jgi:acyl dehydratase